MGEPASLLQKVLLKLDETLREQLVSLAVWSLTLLPMLGWWFLAFFPLQLEGQKILKI